MSVQVLSTMHANEVLGLKAFKTSILNNLVVGEFRNILMYVQGLSIVTV